jgi:hypothetical protein
MNETPTLSSEQPWSEEGVKNSIENLLLSVVTDPAWYIKGIMDTLNYYGYDSIDRECAFTLTCEKLGIDYTVLYDLWIDGECWQESKRG